MGEKPEITSKAYLSLFNGESSVWHWKSRDIGGRSALDYLIYVEGFRFVEAVERLCGESPAFCPAPQLVEKKKPPFSLPPAAPDNRRVFAYLQRRGIGRDVISACLSMGILYESAPYHNAVFVGRDETGEARYAFLRGTYLSAACSFKAECGGSDKQFAFCVPSAAPSCRVAVYESAIDALAHWTLEGSQDKYRLSLGGIYAPKEGTPTRDGKLPPALEAFLQRHPEVSEIEICTDNDTAGRWAARHIELAYQDRYHVEINLPAIEGQDWADAAQEETFKTQENAARHRVAFSR